MHQGVHVSYSKLNDHINVVDVKASRSDISGHQDVLAPLVTVPVQDLRALRLLDVTMERQELSVGLLAER